MARHPEDDDDTDELETASSSPPLLKRLLHYLMLGFMPFVAVVALGIASFAVYSNLALQEQAETNKSNIRKLANALNASRVELKRLNLTLAQEKAAAQQTHAKHEELMAKLVENLSPLQKKLKIHPTLAEQLHQAEAAASAPVAASAPAATPPATAVPQAKSAVPKQPEQPRSPEVKSMLKAIKEFNRQ